MNSSVRLSWPASWHGLSMSKRPRKDVFCIKFVTSESGDGSTSTGKGSTGIRRHCPARVSTILSGVTKSVSSLLTRCSSIWDNKGTRCMRSSLLICFGTDSAKRTNTTCSVSCCNSRDSRMEISLSLGFVIMTCATWLSTCAFGGVGTTISKNKGVPRTI